MNKRTKKTSPMNSKSLKARQNSRRRNKSNFPIKLSQISDQSHLRTSQGGLAITPYELRFPEKPEIQEISLPTQDCGHKNQIQSKIII